MNLLSTIKNSLMLFFLGLPLILINIISFLGIGLGNAGLLFLSIGQLIVVPLLVMILHLFTNIIPDKMNHSDVGQLVPSYPLTSDKLNVYPSFWMAHFVFFFTYIYFNAREIYYLEPISQDIGYAAKIEARKTRMNLIIGFLMFTFIALIVIRYKFTNTETIFGTIFSIGTFGFIGYIWYRLSSSMGIRTMDIFGVAQQMFLVPNAINPLVCVPSSA